LERLFSSLPVRASAGPELVLRKSRIKNELIRELPRGDRPRERLLRHGGPALTDAELVAILLGTGRKQHSAVEVARELLRQRGGLNGLVGIPAEALGVPGLGPAKKAVLLAAVELARRFARAELPEREPLTHPGAVARYLGLRYGLAGQEVMGALYLDTRHRLIAENELFRGTLSRAAVEPRAVLKAGLLRDAAAIILFHTHPSGDPSPSAEDLAFTRRLDKAGDLLGMRLVDHLVLGSGGSWRSLRQRGGW
jgi:DNA repair protein RadC